MMSRLRVRALAAVFGFCFLSGLASAQNAPFEDRGIDTDRKNHVEVAGISETQNAWATTFYWSEAHGEFRIRDIKRMEVGEKIGYPCRVCTSYGTSAQLINRYESPDIEGRIMEEVVAMRPQEARDFPGNKNVGYKKDLVQVYEGKVEVRGLFQGKPVALPFPDVPTLYGGTDINLVSYDPCYAPAGPWREQLKERGLLMVQEHRESEADGGLLYSAVDKDGSDGGKDGGGGSQTDPEIQIDVPGGNIIL